MLSADDRSQIADIIKQEMRGSCLCGLDTNAQTKMGHLMGMIRDVGDGDHDKGIERLRDTAKLSKRISKISERIGYAVLLFIISSALGIGWLFLKLGSLAWISKGGG